MFEGYTLTRIPPKQDRTGVYRIQKWLSCRWEGTTFSVRPDGRMEMAATLIAKRIQRVRGKG